MRHSMGSVLLQPLCPFSKDGQRFDGFATHETTTPERTHHRPLTGCMTTCFTTNRCIPHARPTRRCLRLPSRNRYSMHHYPGSVHSLSGVRPLGIIRELIDHYIFCIFHVKVASVLTRAISVVTSYTTTPQKWEKYTLDTKQYIFEIR